jgi:hypothetical protein
METSFHRIIDTLYSLPLEDKQELVELLGRNIAEERRNEIYQNYLASKSEEADNELEFSSDTEKLKKLL